MQKWKSNDSNISLAQGSEMVPPLPPTPWALTSQGDDEIRDVLEMYAYYHWGNVDCLIARHSALQM